MGVQLDAVTQAHVDKAIDDLCIDFTGVFSRETVARFVSESIVALGGAKFADFVPLLAHRFAVSGFGRSANPRGRSRRQSPRSSSSASRTPDAARSPQRS